ncbi:MAG: hypothetical protein WCA35_22715 [Kovacikia sp.]
MPSRLDSTDLSPSSIKRFKTLARLLAKSSLVQTASVKVVHNYTAYQWGRDYVFEAIEGSSQGYLQGYGGNIQCGDYLLLINGSELVRYHIDEIEHYTDPPDLWIALLRPCSGQVDDRRFWMEPAESYCAPCRN